MVLYFPLSSFLTLFANLLQGNPNDSHVANDLKLMDLATSFLTPSTVPMSPFASTPSMQIFHELNKVAKKFVEKNNPRSMKAKRSHKDVDSEQNEGQQPGNKSEVVNTLSNPNIASTMSDSTVRISHIIAVQVWNVF
jgi:hypothetical protein